jgi:hypothetical protein
VFKTIGLQVFKIGQILSILEPLQINLPQDAATQNAYNALLAELRALNGQPVTTAAPTTFAPTLVAVDVLLQLKENLLNILPNFFSLDDKLEVLIAAAETALQLPVTPASEFDKAQRFSKFKLEKTLETC